MWHYVETVLPYCLCLCDCHTLLLTPSVCLLALFCRCCLSLTKRGYLHPLVRTQERNGAHYLVTINLPFAFVWSSPPLLPPPL